MEFHEKLKELRQQRGLTQEELAKALYVSRTAISKWESGRGYPNIDSIKAIAKFFSVSLDELLSSREVLEIAEADEKQKEKYIRDLVFGLLDLSVGLLFFLPFFAEKAGDLISSASLLSLDGVQRYLKISYLIFVILTVAVGILTLTLQNCQASAWVKSKVKISLILSTAGVFLFIISRQPYAAVFVFALLIIKALLLIKRK